MIQTFDMHKGQEKMELTIFGLSVSVLLTLLQVKMAVSDVRLVLSIPNSATEKVAYNNSYVRAGSIMSGPTDTVANHFVLACDVPGSNRSDIGQWYYPNGSLVGTSPLQTGMSQERQRGRVILYRYGCLECGVQIVGIYKCIITDLGGMNQSLCAGIYTGTGSDRPISSAANIGPVMEGGGTCAYLLTTLPHVDPPTFQINCTSTTSPATLALWTLNGGPTPSSNTTFTYQDVISYPGSVYSNVLVVTGRVPGAYVCNVTTHRIEVPGNSDNVGVDTLVGSPAIGSFTVEDSPGPLNISNVLQLDTTLTISWTAPTSGGAVHNYWVYVAGLIRFLPPSTTSVALPLSTGSRYTVLVVALGRHLPSPPSTVLVEMVTPPTVSISPSQPLANAGASFTLRCQVQFSSVPSSPVTIWWANMTNSILNSTTVQDSSTVHTLELTISPVNAFDGGVYKCGVAVAKYATSTNATVVVKAPAPLAIAKASRTFLIAGDSLQLNCTGLLLPYFDVPGQVTVTWTGPNGVSISTVNYQSTAGGPFMSISQVSVQLSSAGTYTCGISVTFNPTAFLDASSNVVFDQVTIVIIAGPPSLTVKVPDTPAQLGMPYSISCAVVVPPISSNVYDLSIGLKNFDVVLKNVTVVDAINGFYESVVSFDSLNASQVRMYWCEASLGPLSVTASQGISVVVPQPTVTIASSSGLYLVAGDALSLACLVQLDAFKYMDTGGVLNITWRFPRGRERKTSHLVPSTTIPLSFTNVFQLQAGNLGDAGNYSCAVTLQPQQDSMFLTPSIPVESTVEAIVLGSNLTISVLDNGPELGYPYSLTCQVNVPAISTTLLLLQLTLNYSTDALSYTVKNATFADPGNATHQLQIMLPSLTTADAGRYLCIASVGPYEVRKTKMVVVQVSPPSLTVLAEPLYFIVVQQGVTLLCSGVLSSAISTGASINVSWIGPHGQFLRTEQILQPAGSQTFASQFYLPSVPFNGAGNYSCSVTIVPRSSLAYVHGSSASSQVELAVMNGNLTVTIQDHGNPPQLGSLYNLQCNINVPALSIKGQALRIEWILFTDTSNHSLGSKVVVDPGNASHPFQIVFSYLSTTDVGKYMCIGSIGPYSVNGSKVVALQVPPPTLIVSATPTAFIVAQQDLTLLCSILLSPSIQTSTEVSVSWTDPSGQLMKNETWQLRENLNTESKLFLPSVPFSGAGDYTCLVSVNPQPQSIYLVGVLTSSPVGIAIIDGNLIVSIQDDGSPLQIGSPHTFHCSVHVPALSMREQTLHVEWIFINEASFNLSLNSTVIAGTGNTTYSLLASQPSLSNADAGRYVCLATMGPFKVNTTKDILLQVPSPALMISASPSANVVAGSNVTLNCCATLGTQMNGNFFMRFAWTGPDGRTWNYDSLPVNDVFPTCAQIYSVVQSAFEIYTCIATVHSSTPSNFILTSVPTIKQLSITTYPDIQIAGCKSSAGFIGSAKALCTLTGSPSDMSANILNITNNASTLDAQGVTLIVDLLAQLVQFSTKDNKQIQNDFVSIVNNIINLDRELLHESTTNSLLVKTIDMFMKSVSLGENEDVRSFTQDKFVLQAQDLSTSQPQTIVVPDKSFFNVSKANPKLITQSVFVTLPSTLLSELNITTLPGAVRVSSSIFLDDRLFQPQQNISRHFSNFSLGSLIVSASLGTALPVQNLRHPIQISLILGPDAIQNGSNITCVFWDTAANNGVGDWSTQGCRLVSSSNGTAMCECNHLTSFAILFDASPKTESDAAAGLGVQIITFVGLAISIFCLLIIIGTYLISRKLRTSVLGKMLLNLCGSLLALFAVFIASSIAPPVQILCSFLSALLHYTLLAYFFWTASEAIHLYLKLVQVFETRWLQRHYVAVSMAVCWGAPLIIVAISLSGYKDYGNEQFCRPYNLPFYIGFVMPFGIIYIFNWVMFFITFASICHHVTRNDTTAYETFKKQFKIAVTISLLLGLGWAFGFLGTSSLPKEIYIPAQYFFSFFMTSQGALFFFFHGIKSAEVRQEWMRLFYVVTGRSDKYRVYLQQSKSKPTDSTQKSSLTASKVKSKAYSVDQSHSSTNMELKVDLEKLPQEETNKLDKEMMYQDMTESCSDAWDEKDQKEVSPSNHMPSHSPEHTCINIPSEKEHLNEDTDGSITFKILYVPDSKEKKDNDNTFDGSTAQGGVGVMCVESSTADNISDQKKTETN